MIYTRIHSAHSTYLLTLKGLSLVLVGMSFWNCSSSKKKDSTSPSTVSSDAEAEAKAEEIETKAKKAAKTYKVSLASARKYFQLVSDTQDAQDDSESLSVKLASKSGSSVVGHVTLTDRSKGGVIVNYLIGGLGESQEHGFHIHETGNCDADDASSAGGHFNPDKKAHGDKGAETHHAGDMGNLKANSSGVAVVSKLNALVLKGLSLEDLDDKAIIVHEKPDDFTPDNNGNAGARWACGVIKKSEK